MRPLTSAIATCLRGTVGFLLETPALASPATAPAVLPQRPAVLPSVVPTHQWDLGIVPLRLISPQTRGFSFQPAGREKAFVSVPLEVFIEHMARPGALAAACPSISRRQLLQQSVLAAYVLRACGVACGDRVILLMPHCIEQMVWMLAAKRIGALYVSMPVNISLKASRTRSPPAPSSYGCPPSAFSTLFSNLRLPDLDLCLALSSASRRPGPPLAFNPHAMLRHVYKLQPARHVYNLQPARQTSAHHPRR